MKNLMKNHPEWEDACETVLSLLSGGFALPTAGFVWVRELAGRKKGTEMQDTKNIVVYVHGKGGCAREAEHYKPLFPGSEVLGFDYRAQTPWEAREEFPPFFAALRERCETLTLVANSIGAFFSLSALDETLVDNAWLISPVVDMEKLIGNMMQWASVTEGELAQRLEIPTQFGETLSWRYLCDVREHPISWRVPTRILYGEKDNLTSLETVTAFAERCGASLTVMPGGEHWFHTEQQLRFLDHWLTEPCRVSY